MAIAEHSMCQPGRPGPHGLGQQGCKARARLGFATVTRAVLSPDFKYVKVRFRRIGETDITWIGPPADAIDAMGSKTKAREIMDKAGVPIVPGERLVVDLGLIERFRLFADLGQRRPLAQQSCGQGVTEHMRSLARHIDAGAAHRFAHRDRQIHRQISTGASQHRMGPDARRDK